MGGGFSLGWVGREAVRVVVRASRSGEVVRQEELRRRRTLALG